MTFFQRAVWVGFALGVAAIVAAFCVAAVRAPHPPPAPEPLERVVVGRGAGSYGNEITKVKIGACDYIVTGRIDGLGGTHDSRTIHAGDCSNPAHRDSAQYKVEEGSER